MIDFGDIFKGSPTPAKWAALGEYLLAGQITGGPGLRIRRVGNRTVITTRRRTFGTAGWESTGLKPWQPVFFTTGTEEAPVYQCRINLGTLNDVPATNWNDEFTLSMGVGAYHFVVLTITTASGQVTGLTLSIDATAPETDTIAKGTPPVSHKIVLGAIGSTEAKMIEDTNLAMVAAVVFLESKDAPAVGAEPYDRWWRWNHSTI
jgi:hypothetical protein